MAAKQYDEHGIFSYELQRKRKGNKISYNLSRLLADYLPKNEIVYDMGCGTGEYLEYLQESGFRVKGFDGTPGVNELTYVDIEERDLTQELPTPSETGSVISIEVAEHIPKEYEQVFVENLIKYTHTHLVVSWAIPNQGGVGHVNEKSALNVLDLFATYGFDYNRRVSENWRKLAGNDLGWLKNSIYVFTRNM